MLVMLITVLQAALWIVPLQAGEPGTEPGAPTPAARPQAGPSELPAPPAELPPIEAPEPLPPTRLEALGREVTKLRATNPAALEKAQAAVIAFGRPALPALAKAATTNHAGQMQALVHCLTELADYRDRDFVEASLDSRLPVLRRFAARKTGVLALPPLVDRLPPLLEDPDEVVRLEAALALLANGREDGLAIAAAAFDGPAKERVLALLPRVAGRGPHRELEALLRIDPEREKEEPEVASRERLTAVILLHAIGDAAAETLLVRALDDKHNIVQREAINSLRDLFEGQGPLDKSSIFQQINEVKRLKEVWKSR